ncbi:hypothetical protein [Enterococcus alishanensis]|uniref:Uncharacterized protein n=1 Tax=Enterococcus alishanensis TaxID=1303817 RepID=A0ABS6TDQ5_9ENTE|nr:hypothetical protein [Enterococcus alishanensis]MBV7391033.1 hypothetical protein [Enterococcus alishanensis]
MREYKTSEAQRRASKKYQEKANKDPEKRVHRTYLASRRTAKSFIRTKATREDLTELEKMIAERYELLNKIDIAAEKM